MSREIEPGALFAKISLLHDLSLNLVANDNDPSGKKFNDLIKDYNDSLKPIREKLIEANTEADILSTLKEVSDLTNNKYSDFYNVAGRHDHPIVKAVSILGSKLGIDDPQGRLDLMKTQFKDMQDSEFFQKAQKNFTNNPKELAKMGVPITERKDFNEIKEDASFIANKYQMAFFDFPTGGKKEIFKMLKSFHWSAQDFSKKIGMTEDCVGMKGQLGITFQSNSGDAGGMAHGYQNKITLMGDNLTGQTLSHEWLHMLDNIVMENAERHMKTKYGVVAERAGLVSGNNIVLPNDGSPELKAYQSMRNFVSNVVTKDNDSLENYRETKTKKEVQNFLIESLGTTFFALPGEKREELFSPDMVTSIKNKMLLPENHDFSEQLFEKIKKTLGDTPFDETALKSVTHSNNSPIFENASRTFAEIEDYKAVGVSKAVKAGISADEQKVKGQGFNGRFEPLFYKTYNQCNEEVVARYMEGQLYPRQSEMIHDVTSTFGKGLSITKKDENFDAMRRDLISNAFGENSVKELNNKRSVFELLATRTFLTIARTATTVPYAIIDTVSDTVKMVNNGIDKISAGINKISESVNKITDFFKGEEAPLNIAINKEHINEQKTILSSTSTNEDKIKLKR